MRQSGSIRTLHTRTMPVQETFVESCAFCKARIRHLRHVPSGSVRVGQDYGDAE